MFKLIEPVKWIWSVLPDGLQLSTACLCFHWTQALPVLYRGNGESQQSLTDLTEFYVHLVIRSTDVKIKQYLL